MHVLALNMGSTGLKAGLFDADVGGDARKRNGASIESHNDTAPLATRADALLAELARSWGLETAPDMVVHRVVHGGDRDGPTRLTHDELAALQALSALAPLHQAPELAVALAAVQRWPECEHVAVFDTCWHRTMPEIHRHFALPDALYERGVRRYGFHGLAFASGMARVAELAPTWARARVVLAHLGGGSSLCAIRDGASVNTTMGMTPLGGVAMGTRPGSLDPGVVLHLQRALGMSDAEIDHLLWRDSGLQGLSGESGDMRRLLASDSPRARRAVALYASLVAQGIAAMAACIGGLDVLGFSGGIGQNAPAVRTAICEQLDWMGVRLDSIANEANCVDLSASAAPVRVLVLSIDEEREMVREAILMKKARDRTCHAAGC
ncbi:acetate/propionate family kinase [Lysobacter arvi]|uniref:Acetate kinase n=1 Tax=Lysobacter arvi TaxID=3038776 RepID=A0ABU1C9U5_9GAMM|nr:acetate kinase [Lysobacter arvi]MDR0181966.1 acetate kinase [Lysobacter arvi]